MIKMPDSISEREWKILREIKTVALERLCERAISQVIGVASDTTKGAHERYLAMFEALHERDDEIANAFNNLRRSTALRQLACMKYYDLLTEEELARFSAETREHIELLISIANR
jgi:hypothetical protein